MDKILENLIKSIFAGIMIGIAGLTYLRTDNPYLGSFMFCIGLIVICYNGYNLYTGKVGYISNIKDIKNCIIYIIGNLIGVIFIGCYFQEAAPSLVAAKLELPLYLVFWKAIWCGFLMFVAVDIFKKKNTIMGILFCIPTFIIAGFEHSIADMYYFVAAREMSAQAIIFILIVLLGNGLGALLHKILIKYNERGEIK